MLRWLPKSKAKSLKVKEKRVVRQILLVEHHLSLQGHEDEGEENVKGKVLCVVFLLKRRGKKTKKRKKRRERGRHERQMDPPNRMKPFSGCYKDDVPFCGSIKPSFGNYGNQFSERLFCEKLTCMQFPHIEYYSTE